MDDEKESAQNAYQSKEETKKEEDKEMNKERNDNLVLNTNEEAKSQLVVSNDKMEIQTSQDLNKEINETPPFKDSAVREVTAEQPLIDIQPKNVSLNDTDTIAIDIQASENENQTETITPLQINNATYQVELQTSIEELDKDNNLASIGISNPLISEEKDQINQKQASLLINQFDSNEVKEEEGNSNEVKEEGNDIINNFIKENKQASEIDECISKPQEENTKNNEEANSQLTLNSKYTSGQRTNPQLIQQCSNLINSIFNDYSAARKNNDAKDFFNDIESTKQEPIEIPIPIPIPIPNAKYIFEDISQYNNKPFEIITIQNNWRAHNSRQRMLLLKEKVFHLQRTFRKYLIRKYTLPDNFYYNDKFIKLQNDIFEDNLKENLSILFPALFMDKSDLNSLASNMLNFSNNPIHNPYETERINLFAKILDFDMMIESDESYETLWASVFDSIYSKCLKNCAPIQLIALGGQHTLCVNNKGKIFTFGWNNYGQCGVPVNSSIINKEELNDDFLVEITKYNELKPKIINKVDGIKIPEIDMVIMSSSIACGEDHSLILDQEGAVWAFGLNLNGQLGLGHSRIIEKPTKIAELSKQVIVSVKTEGNINFAINNKGDAFMWPWSDKGEIQFSPRRLPLKMVNEKVSSIACGNNFVLILNRGGVVYSMGRTNKFGQLGHGDYNPRLHPSRVEFFVSSSERITQISCGFKHCMAKSSTGRAYTWGLVNIAYLY